MTLTEITGEVRVHSGGGRVGLAQVHGMLTAATVSGAIDLTGNDLQDARIEQIGSGITVRGSMAPKALLDLETHSGPISLYLDRALPPALVLATRSGIVKNPFSNVKTGPGQIAAHSFKGDINVVGVSGIEGKKASTPP